jgi:cellulose synthase/poly-beta-1,6-N-acetylglucosamine synthase-like glycosyltransferase
MGRYAPDSNVKLKDLSGVPRAEEKASLWFKLFLILPFFLLPYAMWRHPMNTVFHTASIIAWLSVMIALLRLCAAVSQKPKSPKEYAPSHYPVYSVLVPLFHEANMVELLMRNLETLNYPREKLEIFLICEAVDPETIAAVEKEIRAPFHLIIVPPGHPQTKPRALNYALPFTKGDVITIYDAEDCPHPDQLKAALIAFEDKPHWAAVQAPLNYYNPADSWIAAQFTLEYSALFHVWLPFLANINFPFPLGGTSNHMRRAPLEDCGGWDAYNVTEDADLSFRLSALGYHIGYILPPTREEAVSTFKAWNDQRSRWMKGYCQTWLMHMHAPLKPRSTLGLARFLSVQFTIAYVVLSALIFTPAVIFAIVYAAAYWSLGWSLPFSWAHFIAFGTSLAAGILIGAIGTARSGKAALMPFALLMPFYWLLLFWPTIRALAELKTRPFHWHKTQHGVSEPHEKA